MKHRHVAGLVVALVLALAAFTGSALAGGGHGNGGGQGNGNANGNAPQAQQTQAPAPSSSDNSTGVKPSNSTKHDTYAPASSNQTKQYGNGKTAGQIATQAGYGNATLHGPGNSQPHKTMCGGHEVDVHALKSKGSACGSSTSQPEQKQSEQKAAEKQQVIVQHEQKHEEHVAAKHEEKQQASVKHDEHQSSESQASSVAGAHVTICHATGSSTNPYVRISPSVSGVYHGHLGHQDGRDIVPPFTYGGQTYSSNWTAATQAIWNAGCALPQSSTSQAAGTQAEQHTSDCGTTTQVVTEQVLVGVEHMIGPKGSGRFVVIHPSLHSAHYTGKHPDDVPIYETVQKTLLVPNANCSSSEQKTEVVSTKVVSTSTSTPGSTQSSQATPAQSAGTVAGTQATQSSQTASGTAPATTATAAPATGGVKGATATLTRPKAKPAGGGVLGATTRLGGTVASTHLPFTGLSLWVFALIAAALILGGLAARRLASDRQ